MAGAYIVTGACDCGQPSTITYRDSRGAPFGEACAECNEWIPKTFGHQSAACAAEARYVIKAFYDVFGAPLIGVLDAIERWRVALLRAMSRS
jgi:hypothetical protein